MDYKEIINNGKLVYASNSTDSNFRLWRLNRTVCYVTYYKIIELTKLDKVLLMTIKYIGGTPLKGSTANSFKGKKGVIVFNDCNWSDATGHVDLFNGIQCEYEAANDYFNNCNSELLYTLK